jgi:hypothetical protein
MRAARERRGLSLEAIAARTKVSVSLWEAMEHGDLAGWPSGLFARSYVRDYARIVGLDAEETVDEFCRCFPQGDRRRGELVRAQADLIDIGSQYSEDMIPPEGERRAANAEAHRASGVSPAVRERLTGTAADLVTIAIVAVSLSALFRSGLLASLGAVGLPYFAVSTAWLGRTPGVMLSSYLAARIPQLLRVGERRLSSRTQA